MNASANLNNVIRALNALGATPIDLMSILQAMAERRLPARQAGNHLMAGDLMAMSRGL